MLMDRDGQAENLALAIGMGCQACQAPVLCVLHLSCGSAAGHATCTQSQLPGRECSAGWLCSVQHEVRAPLLAASQSFDLCSLMESSCLACRASGSFAEAQSIIFQAVSACQAPCTPAALSEATLRLLGMPAWSLQADPGCRLVHSVLQSPRGDGKEAIVLVTPGTHGGGGDRLDTDQVAGRHLSGFWCSSACPPA